MSVSEQSYARIAGHGVALVPQMPFAIGRDGDFVFVQHGERAARVRVVDASLRYVLVGAKALTEVAHAVETAYRGAFRIETSAFSCAWPEGFALVSVDRPGPFLFDLVPAPKAEDADPAGDERPAPPRGDDAPWIFFAGPYTLALCPDLDALVADGQTELARETLSAAESIDVAYEHAGRAFRKRHLRFVTQPGQPEAARAFVITAQGPADAFEGVRAALDELAASLEHD